MKYKFYEKGDIQVGMYKFLSVVCGDMTRWVKLENCETGKVEVCFDDSDLRHEYQKGFELMQIGGIYDCKILLFGIAIDLSDEDAIKQSRIMCETTDRELFVCETIDNNFSIGNRNFLQIISNGNIYYGNTAQLPASPFSFTHLIFFRHLALNLLEIHTVFLRRFGTI